MTFNFLYQGGNICVFGRPGSGKTTFCLKVSDLLRLKYIQLDNEFVNLNKKSNLSQIVIEKMNSNRGIITDGGYIETIPIRVEKSEVIILFNMPIIFCIKNVLKRSISNLIMDTTAHYSTRVNFISRIKYFLHFKLYLRILYFDRKYKNLIKNIINTLEPNQKLLIVSNKEEVHKLIKFFEEYHANDD